MDFTGKNILVTGAGGSLASAVTELLDERGANLLLTDLGISEENNAGRRHWLHMDVSREASVRRAVEKFAQRFDKLDCVIHCAGIFPRSPIETMTGDELRVTLDVNLIGSFNVAKVTAPHIRKGGSIVFISSIAGHRGSAHHSPYAASKAGVLGLTKSLAWEFAPDIRVNAVSPGPIDSPMIAELMEHRGESILASCPLKRLPQPIEVARAIVFMASDWASFINGEALQVNGGLHING